MGWVRLDDGFANHPKLVAVGATGMAMFVAGLCYCSRYLTDGFIPQAQVKLLINIRDSSNVAARLVGAGLWEPAEGGFAVHDYLVYNPSRRDAEASRAARAEAGRRGGLSSSKQTAEQTVSQRQAKAKQTPSKASSKKEAKANPVPVPVSRTPEGDEGADAPADLPPYFKILEQFDTIKTLPAKSKAQMHERSLKAVQELGPIDFEDEAHRFLGYHSKSTPDGPERPGLPWHNWLSSKAVRERAERQGGRNGVIGVGPTTRGEPEENKWEREQRDIDERTARLGGGGG